MLEKIEFPHELRRTLEVVHWLHLHPEEVKDNKIELYFLLGEIPHKLVGEVSDADDKLPRVFLAEHSYGEDGRQIRVGAEVEFNLAIIGLHRSGICFQTRAYSMAPYLFTIFSWSLELGH